MSRSPFPSLRTAGGLFPVDLFTRVLENKELSGREPETYGLLQQESVREAAARAFDYLNSAWHAFTQERNKASAEGRSPRTRDRWLLPVFRALDYGVLQPSGGITVEDTKFPVTHRWEHVPIHLLGWDIDLDHRSKGVAGAAHKAPQSMLQELLNRSDDHLWGLLSNGAKLRLLRDSRALAGSAYVEFDLELIFEEQLFPDFVLLYRLLHATRFAVPEGEPPATCRLEQWRTDAVQVGERALARLRKGVEMAINTLGTGFLQHSANDLLRQRLAGGAPIEKLAQLSLYDTPEKLELYGGDLNRLAKLSKEDYKRAILRLVYRLLFWFVAEDRDVLLKPVTAAHDSAHELVAARDRYAKYFSAQRLRDRALRGGADPHDDLWQTIKLVFDGLGTDEGLPQLAVPGIGGLFERITELPDGTPLDEAFPDALDAPLEGMRISNGKLLQAIRHLAVVDSGVQRRPVNFRELDSEELGSVYESLLELHPDPDPTEQTFVLRHAAGNERKSTGSYYTPSSLTEALLDTTLDPVLDEAARGADTDEAKVEALLGVTVCDPACGSGHFLVAAARRIARRIAQVRSGEDEPSPDRVRHAMREVVSRCIYGVDINEMAAELAKVSLWLESVEPGKPLAFLDANIRVGNALLGATPALIERGIPKAAFQPIEGDDKKTAAAVAKDNDQDLAFQGSLFSLAEADHSNTAIAQETRELVTTLPEDLTALTVQRRRLRALDANRQRTKRMADAWCAAFVQELTLETRTSAITQSTLDWIGGDDLDDQQERLASRVIRLARQHRFFHWHVEFPHLFRVPCGDSADPQIGWDGGFSCVIGNPPWERVEFKELEFFASRHVEISNAKNAATRKKAIAELATSGEEADRRLYGDFLQEVRTPSAWMHFFKSSGRYPLTGRGRLNTYAIFAETGRSIITKNGRVGMILPTGIATDATTQFFFNDMVRTRTLVSLYDFENEERLFRDVHHAFRFCLWSAAGIGAKQSEISLAFRLRQVTQLNERSFTLTPEDISLMNPNTGTCPVFDSKRNADITANIYRRIPILLQETPEVNQWNIFLRRMFHMADDSSHFYERRALEDSGWTQKNDIFAREGRRKLPLYEAKMIYHFDHRFGTYQGQTTSQSNVGTLPRTTAAQKIDPEFFVYPRYWVAEEKVQQYLQRWPWKKGWLIAWRDITHSGNERTLICSALPVSATPDGTQLMLPRRGPAACLLGNMSSFVVDYIARQKSGGTHLKHFTMKQLPVLPPKAYEQNCSWLPGEGLDRWVRVRVLELAYTSYAMEPFARDHSDDGPPYRWDEERRFWLRAELDAAYFHLYGVSRDDVDHIMDTFRAFKNTKPDEFARTKKAIGEIYDAMSDAIAGRGSYQTVLDPPPGQGPRHPARASS